ncbi:MAG: beta-lactamase family protein [Chloroflexia bacterium]|nr:beta-lactamase family protein [Chloroflexia bacterium]
MNGPSGVSAAIWQRGENVADRYFGEAREGQQVTSESIFPLASVTKPIAAAAIVALIEEGLVSLDEPVGRIVPEFRSASPGENESVSIRHLSGCVRRSAPDSFCATCRGCRKTLDRAIHDTRRLLRPMP